MFFADIKRKNGIEYFRYNQAIYLQKFEQNKFLNLFKNKKIGIDLRMYLNSNGISGNRGTAFRIHSISELIFCYKKI
ncbi:conserved hypothetical protein [Candidatus Nitrosotenuis uzonensis]|uniref:MvaI/BcnI restriction endonuclease domain-containing protein n=1 Tax=Candidatus Nitrosotenuis uzonensis TaxID=1407055 RepID=A0A812F4X5_9ARCH|nr:conserved hypothetical protein [Candidatus Nitrosotenuis uzonensis]